MTDLRDGDARVVASVIGEIGEPRDPAELLRTLLPKLSRFAPSELVTYIEVDLPTGQDRQIASEETALTPDLLRAFSATMAEHPLLVAYAESGDPGAVKFSDVVSHRQLQQLAVFREFFVPLGVDNQMGCGVFPRPGVLAGFCWDRAGPVDFTEYERATIDLARLHLQSAMRIAELRQGLTRVVDSLEIADDAVQSVVALRTRHEIDRAAPSALALLDRYFTEKSAEGAAVPGELSAWLSDRATLEHRPDFVADRGGRRLRIRRIAMAGEDLLLLTEYVAAPKVCPPVPGLSPREAEVLWEVAQGRSSRQVARLLGISPRTVDKHLEHASAKLGAPSRTAAVARAFGLTRRDQAGHRP
ncbi:response regulator transcription factor [Nocardia sp. NPDC052566]|uniref:response regulator transcription factor n=1 Tax=Nocardia sp. NPDC052566 TaxID=3364330 RepID=UPI0037CB6E34